MNAPLADHAAIARGLSGTFPELGKVSVVKTLGTGFNSIAVETNNGLVFRIAKTEGTAARFAMEQRLLPILSRVLPVAVPAPQWFAPATERFPLGIIGYQKLAGRTLQPSLVKASNRGELADQVADVLVTLHRIQTTDLMDVGLPQPEQMPANFRSLADETRPALRERLSTGEFETIERWWSGFLADGRMTEFEPALTHGDFWFENMIVDEAASRIVGVVDWEHAAIGDRAQDLATQGLRSEFTADVLTAYVDRGGRADEDDRYRMRRLWELRHFYGVLYGVRFCDEKELVASIRNLRDGPILTASDAP